MVTLSQFSPYLLILFELRNLEHSLSVSSSLQFLCSWLLLHSLCLWTSASSWSYPGVKRHWLNHWQLPSCLCGASSRCIIRLQPWSQGFFGEFRLEGWIPGAQTCVSSSSNFDPYSRSGSLLGGRGINEVLLICKVRDSFGSGKRNSSGFQLRTKVSVFLCILDYSGPSPLPLRASPRLARSCK